MALPLFAFDFFTEPCLCNLQPMLVALSFLSSSLQSSIRPQPMIRCSSYLGSLDIPKPSYKPIATFPLLWLQNKHTETTSFREPYNRSHRTIVVPDFYTHIYKPLVMRGAPPYHHPKNPKGKIVTQPMSHFLVLTKTGPWVLPEAVYPSNHPSVWLACQISRPVSLISSVGDAACDLEARDREPLSLLHYCLLFCV